MSLDFENTMQSDRCQGCGIRYLYRLSLRRTRCALGNARAQFDYEVTRHPADSFGCPRQPPLRRRIGGGDLSFAQRPK